MLSETNVIEKIEEGEGGGKFIEDHSSACEDSFATIPATGSDRLVRVFSCSRLCNFCW